MIKDTSSQDVVVKQQRRRTPWIVFSVCVIAIVCMGYVAVSAPPAAISVAKASLKVHKVFVLK